MRLLRAALPLLFPTITAFAATPLDSARALLDARKLPEAQTAFEKLAVAEPKNADVQFYLGAVALFRGDFEKAVACDEKAVQFAPEVARYHAALGDAYGSAAQKAGIFSKFGLAKKCKAAYDRAVALEPANVNYHQAVFEYCRLAPSIVGGGSDKAGAEAAIILKLDPVRGHLDYATLAVSAKNFDEALTHAAEIKKFDPAAGRTAYVQIYLQTTEYDKALAQLDEALATQPDDYGSLYAVGRLADISGKFLDRGVASLRRCLELTPPSNQPSHAVIQWRLGNVLVRRNDTPGARAAYEASLKLEPTFTRVADALKKLK
jgi:tetratricopeptide (TPR) repeat protein